MRNGYAVSRKMCNRRGSGGCELERRSNEGSSTVANLSDSAIDYAFTSFAFKHHKKILLKAVLRALVVVVVNCLKRNYSKQT